MSNVKRKTQMAMWAIFAAPLLMSVDLRTIKPDYKAILQNRHIISVNQDRLGIQGRRIYKQKGIEIWARPILPVYTLLCFSIDERMEHPVRYLSHFASLAWII